MISEKALAEFKQLWKEKFGADIFDERAAAEATSLLTLMDIVYRPVKKEWMEEYK